ncbi:MAG: hypothetical protein F7C81_05195 [Desulfurococcales archaeon]|nr:hypothetical protein [Desulfurococcales archaeon]
MGGKVRPIIITTSRRPSPRTRSLVKDLVRVIPSATRITRGHLTMEELARDAILLGANRVAIIGERRGNPSIIRFYEPRTSPLSLGNIATILIRGVTLAREAGNTYPPANIKILSVQPDPTDLTEELAEALLVALNARIGDKGDVVAKLEYRNGEALLYFTYKGRSVGPRLRVAKPRNPLKVAET